MKRISKLFAVALAVIMTMQCSIIAFAEVKTGSKFNSSTYTHQTQFDTFSIEQGIDVSYHNGTINWAKVKSAGVDFAILRVGYRGYAPLGKVLPDSNFATYIKDAYAQGIKLGIYFYSQALTTDEAVAEAEFSIEKLQEAVKDIPDFKLDLPIFYDYEFAPADEGRLNTAWADKTLNKTKMTNNALAFCNAVKSAGYEAMVYANKSFLNTQLNKTTLANAGYRVWLAHYTTKTDYSGAFSIWQYTSTGKVNGISGNVDCNFMYIDNSQTSIEAIPDQAYTGQEIKPEPVVKYQGTLLVNGRDYIVDYYNNTAINTANMVITFTGDYVSVPVKVASFKIVPPAITGLKLEKRNIKSVDVSWLPIENVDGYKVEVKKSTGWVSAGTTKNTTHTITGLSVASNYQVRVRGYKTIIGENYDGIYSEMLQTATKPDKVSGLSTTARSTTSVTVSWAKQSNASCYDIYKYNSDTDEYELYMRVDGGKTNTAKITGLKANKSYKIKVQAVKNAKEGVTLKGTRSNAYTVYTKPSATKITKATSSKSKRLTVKWKKISSVTGYQVKWAQNSSFSGSKTVTVKGASSLSKTVTTSKSKKTYYVKVRAYKTVNGTRIYSSWSDTVKIKVK